MKRKLLAIFLAAVLAVGLLAGTALADGSMVDGSGGRGDVIPPAGTSGTCGGNVTWDLTDGVLTISGTGNMWDYWLQIDEDVPPWEYHSMKDIYSEEIHTVVIGDGVTSIGANAFLNCVNLTDVTIPDSVNSIGWSAFSGCASLTGVTIPDGVTNLGMETFADCASLTSVTIPASITYIGAGAFADCTSLTDVYYGGSESQWGAIMGLTADWEDAAFADGGTELPGLDGVTVHYNSAAPDTTEPTEPTEPETPAITFDDVAPGIWYEDAVAWAVENGLIEGNPDGTFSPNGLMTNAAAAAVLARLDGETVTGSAWSEDAMAWAVDKDIYDGSNPDGSISREELAVMLWRYAGRPEAEDVSILDDYPDSANIHTGSDFREAMAWAVENGIINGATNGKLYPLGTATRAEAVTILLRYCEKPGE